MNENGTRMARRVFSVTQVNRYIKRLLEDDALLAGVFVEGELSNVKPHSSGHLYFTLKDEYAAVNGVMFKSHAQSVAFAPRNGMKAVVFGYVSLYEKTGQYQLYAEYMEPAGIGSLQTAFLQLRDKLRDEGLFDDARKKNIPPYPRCVAVVTSPTGAAVRDIIRTIQSRNTAVKVVVAPAIVQGESAAPDIARAIAEVNEWAGADVILLARGGGSMEDLWAFNEEITARAVAGSRIPVISGVGHETDFTIADFAADLRAPTPTAAAVLAVPNRNDLLGGIQALTDSLHMSVASLYTARKNAWQGLTRSHCLQKPLSPLYERQMHIHTLAKTLARLTFTRLSRERAALENRTALLEKVSPYALWERGYSVVRDASGHVVASVRALHTGDTVTLRFKDGVARAAVTGVNED